MFWDGTRWIDEANLPTRPVPPARRSRSRHLPITGVLGAAVAALVVITLVTPASPIAAAGAVTSVSSTGPGAVLTLAPGKAAPGQTVAVTGTSFPFAALVQLAWDGRAYGMPRVTASQTGTISSHLVVPATAATGSHKVSAIISLGSSRRSAWSKTSTVSVGLVVSATGTADPTAPPAPTAAPTVAPTPAPTKAPAPTAAPTVAPTPDPTVAPTPNPTANPTVAPTPDPTVAPTQAPTPAPTAAPTATPAPTPAPTATPAPPADPTVFYLSPSGSDSASGSIGSPWKSIFASLKKLSPGDTLYVRGGAYSFGGVNYTTVAGTAAKPITVAAYPGETPVFTGTTTPADFLYFSGSSAYVTLRGLTIQGGGVTSDSNGSSLLGFIDSANHITIDAVHLVGAAGWSTEQHLAYVAATSVNHITFTNNVFDGKGCMCAGLLQFYHDPNAATISVTGNTFANADQGVMIWATVSGLTVSSNSFSGLRIAVRYHNSGGTSITGNTGSGCQTGIYTDSTANLTQSGNSW